MIESVKKLGLLGIGLAALTQEKLQELIEELEKKGEISREEGKKIAREAMAERERKAKEIQQKIASEVERALAKVDIASKKDIEKLDKRIAKLEKAIEKLAK
jgi:polyhydroxyalkanoate synthesis regulator phasin